jgi:enoyl-[acyl-carrier protein] reductase II
VGTRFLASQEASISDDWKRAILTADSEEVIRAELWWEIFPMPPGEFDVVPRSLATAFLDRWQGRPEEAKREAERIRAEVMTAAQHGRMEEKVPFTGQSAGLIDDILPGGEIVRQFAQRAEEALNRARAAFIA